MGDSVKGFLRDERAASMVEYGIMLALVAAICIAIIGSLGGKVNSAFVPVSNELP